MLYITEKILVANAISLKCGSCCYVGGETHKPIHLKSLIISFG